MKIPTAYDIAEALRFARDMNNGLIDGSVNIDCNTTKNDPPSDDDMVTLHINDEITLVLSFEYRVIPANTEEMSLDWVHMSD